MDPYICPEALDSNNNYYSIKMDNLKKLDESYDRMS
jgi:hypothetical protein